MCLRTVYELLHNPYSWLIWPGRRYHAYFGPDKNLHPTDEKEQDRLDIHHEIFLGLLDGELHTAPLKRPHRVLDIGTGTGLWCVDFANTYPMAEIIGTDLSPIQPAWVPNNCKFEVDDAEQEFTFRPASTAIQAHRESRLTCSLPG